MTIYFENEVHDPFFNLAAEEILLRDTSLETPVLLLWQNEPTVVVGRNQNTLGEINQYRVAEKSIRVVRRLTGGGAVYHDLGTLNYSFILPDRGFHFDFERPSRPILSALARMGLHARLSGRNDLEIAGKKCSGAAQTRIAGRLLHHGSILFQTDLNVLSSVLNVSPDKLESKAVPSVRARVANIVDLLPSHAEYDLETFKRIILEEIAPDGLECRQFSNEMFARIKALSRTKYATWEWNYGHSPPFNLRRVHRYPWGTVDLRISVKHGIVQTSVLYGDFFATGTTDAISQRMVGVRFERLALADALNDQFVREIVPTWSADEMIDLLFAREKEDQE